MIKRHAYKYRLRPNKSQAKDLYSYVGCRRYVFNFFLAKNLSALEQGHRIMRYEEMANMLVFLKQTEECSFLKEAPSQSLQQTLKQQFKAFMDCFDKSQKNKKRPRFKKKGLSESITLPQGCSIQNRRLKLPKLGWVRFRKDKRKMEGNIKNITISLDGDKWYVSIQVEKEVELAFRSHSNPVGIDLGVKRTLTLSTGQVYAPIHSYKKAEEKLAKEQRKLKNKEKGSNNRAKQLRKLSKIHKKIRDKRRDYLHKISHEICKNHALVVMEDLRIQSMTKSAKGDLETPGKNVSAKSGLNKSILDQGWGMLREYIRYKLDWSGGCLLLVDPKNTSLKCPVCHHVDKGNRLSQEAFFCVKCKHKENADDAASKNILAAGHAVLACEAKRKSVRQQESAGNREIVLT